MERDCAPPHLSELDEAVFGKRSQKGLAKISWKPNTQPSRNDLQSILHENQSLVQKIWKGIADEKFPKETSNGQLDKPQLPGMKSGKRPKNSRESGTVREIDFSGKS